jgi:phage host-nuclease inhibitor protein Gam
MSTARLTDARDTTFGAADALLQQIFDVRLAILRREAAAEKQISEIREHLSLDTAPARLNLELAEARLSAFCHAHKTEFVKPRMRATQWGKYGLRTSTRLQIRDPEALLQWAKDNGYTDLYKVEETLIKQAVTKRCQAGELVPGADLETGEASEYKLDTAALEAEL